MSRITGFARFLLAVVAGVGVGVAMGSTAHAEPCRDNTWQPTYVHDLVNVDGKPFYVMANGSFVEVAAPYEVYGPMLCQTYGVRDRRGFTDCAAYTRVQCGCDRGSLGNSTCASFLGWRKPGAPVAPAKAKVVQRFDQPEARDPSGRVTVEAATIQVIVCDGAPSTRRHYIYQYAKRQAFRAILPPAWGSAIGGRDFGTYDEAVNAACAAAAP